MVTIYPDGKEFVFSYKQGFEPNYRSIQQGDDTDYDEDLVEYGGKKRRTRRNKSRKSRRNKSKIRKSKIRKSRKTKSKRYRRN
jgi:hypothetical protein